MTAGTGETCAGRLAEFCLSLVRERCPEAPLGAVPAFLLDYLGNAIGGSVTASARAAQRFAAAHQARGRSTAFGVGLLIAPHAALVNGVAAHSLEMDDTHQPGSLHPGVTVFSAALAAADEVPDGDARFLPAVVAGYEMACRTGMALRPAAHYDRGFHPTATAGVFGAAAAAGLVLGLDADRLTQAFGIAGSMAAGLMEFLADGSWTKRFHPGWAAHSGIVAARLAEAGYTGPGTVFEGRHGFLRAYSPEPDPAALFHGLGSEFQILRTSIKAHACCRYKQAPIDGILEVMRANALREEDVQEVRIGVLSAGWDIIVEPEERKRNPETVVDAQFSMPYGAAVALLFGRASVAEYRPELLTEPEVRRVMAKVRCVRDPELDAVYPERWPAAVEVHTTDGRRYAVRVDYPKGDPENPLSAAELERKFRFLTSAVLRPEAQDAVVRAAGGIGEPGGFRRLSGVLRELNRALSEAPTTSTKE